MVVFNLSVRSYSGNGRVLGSVRDGEMKCNESLRTTGSLPASLGIKTRIRPKRKRYLDEKCKERVVLFTTFLRFLRVRVTPAVYYWYNRFKNVSFSLRLEDFISESRFLSSRTLRTRIVCKVTVKWKYCIRNNDIRRYAFCTFPTYLKLRLLNNIRKIVSVLYEGHVRVIL